MIFCETKFIVSQEAKPGNQTEKNIILNQWDLAQIECIYTKSNTDRTFKRRDRPHFRTICYRQIKNKNKLPKKTKQNKKNRPKQKNKSIKTL